MLGAIEISTKIGTDKFTLWLKTWKEFAVVGNDTPLRIWGSVDPFRNSTLMSYGEKESRSNERKSGRGVSRHMERNLLMPLAPTL